jgi:uncharacterized protein (TIGR02757 family)
VTPAPEATLADRLERLAGRYDRSWIETDPLRWPRLQEDPADREVVAVVAALLAYGRVASIQRSVASALARLPERPSRALATARRDLPARFEGFRHRFTAGEDLAWALEGVARALESHGSLGALVGAAARGRPEPLRAGLGTWHDLAASVEASPAPARRRARAHLLPDPRSGSACKRTLLLARWCAREDDGLDLGLWTGLGLEPRDLLLPLDTHVHRVVRQVGLTRRPRPDWAAAVEVTAALARFDPDDPVRFDFALARPGIVGLCRHRHVPEVCGPCDLRPSCAFGTPGGRLPRAPRRRATSGSRTSGSPRTRPSPPRSSRRSGR